MKRPCASLGPTEAAGSGPQDPSVKLLPEERQSSLHPDPESRKVRDRHFVFRSVQEHAEDAATMPPVEGDRQVG